MLVLAAMMVVVGAISTFYMMRPQFKLQGGRVSGYPPAIVVVGLVIPFVIRIICAGACLISALPAAPPETKEQHDARMKWWREARFGLFIHWGIYSVPAGIYEGKQIPNIGEWIMNKGKIPMTNYQAFAKEYNPTKYNADAWVKLAKQAGMKYIVITSKHHDGFALYNSRVSNYDVVDATPYHRDLIKALAAETKRQGLKFCFYYSILDWHHPSQYVDAPGKDPTAGNRTTKMRPGGKEQYVSYMKSQLRELITTYDPAVLWFDGE